MEETENKGKKIKKIFLIIFIALIALLVIGMIILYMLNKEFREIIDNELFRKSINSQDIYTIDLDVDKQSQIYCYDTYICTLKDKNLKLYNQTGQNITEIPIPINTAIFESNNKYLAIAEKLGQEICVIQDKMYQWKSTLDGQILQIHLNKNGYLAVLTTDTTYKSVITLYDNTGKVVLKNYLASARIVDVTISNNNKFVSFAEIDTSGTLIKSTIKILSVEKAVINPNDAIIYTYEAPISKMIVNIQYQDDKLFCTYNDSINLIENQKEIEKIEINNKMTFTSVDFTNAICYIEEETNGMFKSKSIVNLENTKNGQKNTYDIEEVAKEIYTKGNIIGINIGTEIYFLNTNGMLLKKYTSNQEITNVMFSNEIAILVYKDRIEIIDL